MKYQWADGCFGYHYLQAPGLSVIREEMAPKSSETLHYHNITQQSFYILQGSATFIIDNDVFELSTNDGLHITPGIAHTIQNNSKEKLEFLVISQPPVDGDRINISPIKN